MERDDDGEWVLLDDLAPIADEALRKDAERWRDLEANWNASIGGQTLHMWIATNSLRLGGVAAALDYAMAAQKEPT